MPTIIPGVASDETVSVKFVQTLADPAAPKLTELNAASAVQLECLLTENFAPDASADTTQIRRMCSKQTQERAGTVTRTIADLVGAYDPQDLAAPISKAYAALAPGATGFLVVRWGIHVDTAWATGDLVDVFPVEIAFRAKMAPEQSSELKFKAKPLVTGTVVEDVPLAA